MTTPVTQPLLVAVSGGIDSVVLLDKLARTSRPLIVAHVNHGIRPDSDDDEAFVRQLASMYNIPFVSAKLSLGPDASEETARVARYLWLEQQQMLAGASAIATAHHQDDVLETIVINLTRGTGWRGLCSLRSTSTRYRPLLSTSKAEIVAYALDHHLEWREDSTNDSFRYLRNRVRHTVIPRFGPEQRRELLSLYDAQSILRESIDSQSQEWTESYCTDGSLARYPLIMLEESVALELLRTWLTESLEFSRMRDLLLFAKTARIGAKWSLDGSRFVQSNSSELVVLSTRD